MSKVSVCIPAYKQPEQLRKALDSVLIQTYQECEIVITDDSPDDAVRDVVEQYGKNGKIKYFKNERQLGSPENWNESIRRATGEYIKMLHHDDWLSDRNSLAKYVKMLDENQDADFAFSGSLNFNPDGELEFKHTANRLQIGRLKKDPECLFIRNFVGAPSATIFRNRTGLLFNRRFKWVVDLDFYIRILKNNPRFAYTVNPLVSITIGSGTQVTAQCENNKNVEIGEYLALYNELAAKKKIKFYKFGYIWCLFERYKIKSLQDINKCGYVGKVPQELLMILFFQRQKILRLPLISWLIIVRSIRLTLNILTWVIRTCLISVAYIIAAVKKSHEY